MKKVLIIGLSGQDGSLLANFLLNLGRFVVFGTSRNVNNNFTSLKLLNIFEKVKIVELNPLDFNEVHNLISSVRPDFIFNLSGQTSVGKSFAFPLETYESNILTTLNILEAINKIDRNIRFLNAASTECYGETDLPADELTNFNPISPYAVAKTSTVNITKNYRDIFGIFACSAILSNHESSFRNENFISSKIVNSAIQIKQKKASILEVGNIDIFRDWGWAEDYVEALYLILCQDKAEEYIVATGKSISLEEFISYSFSKVGLNYLDYLKVNNNLIRLNEHKKSLLNPAKAEANLNWKANSDVYKVIDNLFDKTIINYSI